MPGPHAAMATADWAGAAAAFGKAGWDHDRALMLSLLDDQASLADALTICRRLDAPPLEDRVSRRMRALGYRVPRGPQRTTRGNPAGLTAREVEVLQLVADGMTNAEIAERLHVSPRTAEHHVSALLAKLAVPTRRHAVSPRRRPGPSGPRLTDSAPRSWRLFPFAPSDTEPWDTVSWAAGVGHSATTPPSVATGRSGRRPFGRPAPPASEP